MARGWEPMLEQVARERYPRLVARAMLLVPSRSDAEDLVQEALVATFTARARFESVGQAEQYVRRAIVSRFVDRVRRRDRERSAVERTVAPTAAVDGRPRGAGAVDEPRGRAARAEPAGSGRAWCCGTSTTCRCGRPRPCSG